MILGGSPGCVDRPTPSENTGGVPPVSPELRFLRRVPAAGPPEAFTLAPDSYVAPEVFIAQYAPSLWNLSRRDELRLVSTLQGFNGSAAKRYEQFFAGYRVKSGRIDVNVSADGVVVSGAGKPIGGLEGLPTEVRISESRALEQARGRAASACSLSEPLTFAKPISPALMISDRDRRLIWLTTVVVSNPKWVEWAVEIDAATGQLLREWGGFGINGSLLGCRSAK